MSKLKIKRFKFNKETMKIRELLFKLQDIDMQPVGQRLNVEQKYGEKANDIIKNIIEGQNLGELTIHETPKGKYKFESIDGGHRKRYIHAFWNSKFAVEGKFFKDLTREEQDAFLDAEITITVYHNLSVWDIGYIFRNMNKTTDFNHQEMLNSYGDIPLANVIRETVRHIPYIGNKIHSLFEYTTKSDESVNFNLLQFNNLRLKSEEMISRLFCRYYKGGDVGEATDVQLEEMFKADLSQDIVDKMKDKVYKMLDFIEQISEIKKRKLNYKLSQREFVLYSRIWLYMQTQFESFSINDYELFFIEINKVYIEFTKRAEDLSDELKQFSPFDASKTLGQQFKDTLGEHKNEKAIKETLSWLLESVDMLSIVTLKDPQRLFSRADRERKLTEQGFKCYITGEPLDMKNAEGGHIIAHSKGGRTTYDNLAMISAKINKEMGSLSIEEYKQLKGIA